ncbi:Laminin subunit beta-4 [Sciurus carolinensis]|uniref:Laminin subunit beta-4 n=1 Tax=Sciurus carolinensis TaxID=30640 RepID=A0AA41N6C5_SCICA|nr:Laminin subunit beta-4 [Sciurus carolinensis]
MTRTCVNSRSSGKYRRGLSQELRDQRVCAEGTGAVALWAGNALENGWLSCSKAQDECDRGACRPTPGNLLLGRSTQLTASSTCGLNGAQKYCILSYLEGEQKCFACDSRFPYDPYTQPNSHTIENVITSFEPDRGKKWWQSENGLDHVTIRLDLEALFQFSHLILTFKTFRPAAMLVERSTDYGHTWKVLRYFAKDCAASFPHVTSGQAQGVGDLVCDSKYSDIEPSTGGEVVLKVLDPSFEIENPYSPYIQDLVTLTNLRINFTKLHTLGDTFLGRKQNDSLDKYYYALYEMVLRGSCFCNGHASECDPSQKERGDTFSSPGMVHGRCVCQHNTEGPNCERCKDFFQDAPWRPAMGSQDSACRSCSCNGHSDRCHFDLAKYLESGGLSGGVCEDCQHHTEGQHCDRCRPLFYKDPLKAISDPDACLPCECDPDGTVSGGICVSYSDPAVGSVAGQCLCKENVEGVNCDRCKPNHYGLSASDPLGCQPCNCNPLGSLPLKTCDVDTGQCLCQAYVTGPHCEECTFGEQNQRGKNGCLGSLDLKSLFQMRQVEPTASRQAPSGLCSPKDGQCECRPQVTGRSCNEPAPGYFFAPLNFYLYEAEEATPLQGLAPLILATALPKCDVYFRQQGNDFRIDKGNIILKKNQKQSTHAEEQNEVPAVHVVFRELVPGNLVTWTGPGFARVLPGAGLRFAVNNIPFPMDFTIAIRYETQSAADWAIQILVNPPVGGEYCTHKTPPLKPQSFALPATARIMLLPTPICLEPDVQYSVDVYFFQPLESHAHSHILVDSLGLIPQISSLEDFCSKQDMDEYQLHNCVEIASEVGPQVLSGACERLVVSMSAKLHNGAVGVQCGECSSGFYGNPSVSGTPCQPCACNNNIDVTDPESCNRVTGECLRCLHNTQGPNCQLCKPGHFGSALNQTCRRCSCHPSGVSPTVCPPGEGACLCDPITGACPCLPNVTGLACDRCADGHWNLVPGRGCQPCDCDHRTSQSSHSCDCNREGTQKSICDPNTGRCHCREGVSGQRCDQCARGHSQEFPTCLRCHLCFDQWDQAISSLSKAVQGLMRLAANMEDKRETLPVCEADFKGLRENMTEIERILKHPVLSSEEFLKVKDYHDSIR